MIDDDITKPGPRDQRGTVVPVRGGRVVYRGKEWEVWDQAPAPGSWWLIDPADRSHVITVHQARLRRAPVKKVRTA